MRVLLVAKPWKGGLARYVHEAFAARPDTRVEWLATAPDSAAQRREYRRNRRAWRDKLVQRISNTERDVAFFINWPRGADALDHHPGNVLWLTDAARIETSQLLPFARIFASDPGHAQGLQRQAGEQRFAGVLPFAMSPSVHRQLHDHTPNRDVCFIGNRDSKRDAHIAALLSCGFSASVVGNYFANSALFWRAPWRFRPRVSIDAMAGVYARHHLSLNVHARVVAAGTNMRTFECAGYGIAQLVEDRPGLAELFEPGRDIATYSEPAELREAIARLRADPHASAAMARRARQRALGEHTYAQRVEQVLSSLT